MQLGETLGKDAVRTSLAHMRRTWRQDALVAQLDRASDFESEGCRFESCPARHFSCCISLRRDRPIRIAVAMHGHAEALLAIE